MRFLLALAHVSVSASASLLPERVRFFIAFVGWFADIASRAI